MVLQSSEPHRQRRTVSWSPLLWAENSISCIQDRIYSLVKYNFIHIQKSPPVTSPPFAKSVMRHTPSPPGPEPPTLLQPSQGEAVCFLVLCISGLTGGVCPCSSLSLPAPSSHPPHGDTPAPAIASSLLAPVISQPPRPNPLPVKTPAPAPSSFSVPTPTPTFATIPDKQNDLASPTILVSAGPS